MSKITILNNKTAQLETEEYHLRKIIKLCSYVQPGATYSQAYQNGWSGIVYLINRKNQFSVGLLKTVENYFIENKLEYTIIDLRHSITDIKPLDISQKLNELNLNPRDYQLRILEATQNNTRGVIRACTGSGKTLVAAMIAAHFNKPTIIYVIGLDLLDQFHKLFSSIFDEEIGYIGNGICNLQRISIVSIWSAGKALNLKTKDLVVEEDDRKEKFNENHKLKIAQYIKDAKILMMDECHMGTCETISQIYKASNPERIYGLSGTPYKDDGTDIVITSIFGEKICDVSASELIQKGVLAQPIIKFVKVPKLYVEGQNYQTIYKEYIVENSIRNNLIIKHTSSMINKGYYPVILFKNIAHGKELFKLAENSGINCALLSGSDKLDKRNEVKDKYINREIQCIIASTIFDVGVNIENINCLILAGSGKSRHRTLQKAGRAIRMCPGKTHAAIIDFYDDIRYLKTHSKTRYKTYLSEPGFKVIPCQDLT